MARPVDGNHLLDQALSRLGIEEVTVEIRQEITGAKGIDLNLNQWHALYGLVHAAKIGLYPSIFDPHTGKLPAIWGTAERITHLTC